MTNETVLIPISVMKYFNTVERIDPFYVQAREANDVPELTRSIKSLLESRHRQGARYSVENLSGILEAAENCPVSAITVEDAETGEQLFP